MIESLFSKLDPSTLSDPSTFAGPLYALFIVLEVSYIMVKKRGGDYETRDTAASILMGVGNVIATILLGGIGLFILFQLYAMRLFDLAVTPFMLLIVFLFDDLRFYWSHRFSHRIRWFWANHVVHHSSQHYNLSTALRQPWFNAFSGMVFIYTPFVLLGVHPLAIVFVSSINLLYQFFIHTEAIRKLPRWIEFIFSTPSHHRVHHSTNPEYLDTNYGGVLIIWDRLFRTFVEENEQETIRYGIVNNLGTFNPLRISSHEFVAIFKDMVGSGLSLRQRLAYIFAVPGWSHDDSRMTSDQIKDQARKQKASLPLP